jgi:deoxycytidylate deaminase
VADSSITSIRARNERPAAGGKDALEISLEDRRTAELVIALVGAAGSGVSTCAGQLKERLLGTYKYDHVEVHKVSDIIRESAHLVGKTVPAEAAGAQRISLLQEAGDLLRKKFSNAYLAQKAVERIAQAREQGGYAPSGPPLPLRNAHIIDSLKNPDEVACLREVYGDVFWLVTVFAPRSVRERRLKDGGVKDSELSNLIATDEYEQITGGSGQNVRETSELGDFFIRNDQDTQDALGITVRRYLEILFNVKVHTPLNQEAAMYAAASAGAKSACLSRQVGAAIYSKDNELIGIGWNDVPRAGGGLYAEDLGMSDLRCFRWGEKVCHNDKHKGLLYENVFAALKREGLLSTGTKPEKVREVLSGTDIRNLIEFSRAVHAEMEAIISVGRGSKGGLVGATMYSTTFPCHSCARHIVASGIAKVVYIEPYPKSLALALHTDAVTDRETGEKDKVVFLQYEGTAPRNMLRLFQHGNDRKQAGRAVESDPSTALPVFPPPLDGFAQREQMVVEKLKRTEEDRTATDAPGA